MTNTNDIENYECLASLEASVDWDWDIIAVWREKATDRLFVAADGGCSCNGPWESGLGDLTPLRTRADLEQVLKDNGYLSPATRWGSVTDEEVSVFRDRVRTALRRKGARA